MSASIEELAVLYVDGELAGMGLQDFEELMRCNAQLQMLVERHRSLRTMISRGLGPTTNDTGLEAIAARIGGRSSVICFAPNVANIGLASMLSRRSVSRVTAIAASLLVGILGGWMINRPTPGVMIQAKERQLAATGELEATLTNRLAAESRSGPIHIGLSFASDQKVCRTFSSDAGLDGLACRSRDRWIIEAAATSPRSVVSTEYRLASSQMSPDIMSAVDRIINGAPFDAVTERYYRERNWER